MPLRAHRAALLADTGVPAAPLSASGPASLAPYSGISNTTSRRLVAEYKASRHANGKRSPDDYVAMGQAYLTSGYAEPAVRCFTSALLDASPRVDALYGRGNAYELMEAYAAAIADYSAAIKVQPLTPQLFKSLAGALLAMDRYEEAMAAYTHTMAICSIDDDNDAKEAYGRCLFELSEHERAEAVLSEVLRDDRGRAVSLMYRGCARMELRGEDDSEAQADFEAAHALDPTLPTQMRQRAQREVRMGNAEGAALTLSRCARLDKNNPLVLFERARCWLRCFPPDVPRALADMSECANRLRVAQSGFGDNDALIGCLRGRADLLLERNRPAEAVVQFDELVSMYPPGELPRGVVVGRLRATHALQAKRIFDEDRNPEEWTDDEIARATLDSDTLCDVHTAALGDPAAVGFLLKETSSTQNAHYLRANLLARNTWAKPIGTRRDEAMREALDEFRRAHACGFAVHAIGAGRPGVVVTTAWSLGAAEPEYREAPRPVSTLAKLCAVALAAAGAGYSGVGSSSPGFAHAALAALLARETLPRAPGEQRPRADVCKMMIAHILAQRSTDTAAFDWVRWAGTLLSASAIVAASAYGDALPDTRKPAAAPTGKAAGGAGKSAAGGTQRAAPPSLVALCVCAIGGALPKSIESPFELTVQVRARSELTLARRAARGLAPRRPGERRMRRSARASFADQRLAIPMGARAPQLAGGQDCSRFGRGHDVLPRALGAAASSARGGAQASGQKEVRFRATSVTRPMHVAYLAPTRAAAPLNSSVSCVEARMRRMTRTCLLYTSPSPRD